MVSTLARHDRAALIVGLPFSFGYVVYLAVRTWRITRRNDELSRHDAWLLKWSGGLAAIPAPVLLGLSAILKQRGIDIEQYVSGTNWGWFLFQCQAEFGAVLSFACLIVPIRHRSAPKPVWLWKLIYLPLRALYFVYVIRAFTGGFRGSMAR